MELKCKAYNFAADLKVGTCKTPTNLIIFKYILIMSKVKSFEVQGTYIMVSSQNNEDYICLTDIVRSYKGGADLIDHWLRNKSTIDYLGVWKKYNNPNFNYAVYEGMKN